MKKLKLEAQSTTEFRGLGIVSPEKDYRLCFFFNQALELNLEKTGSIFRFDPLQNKNVTVSCFIHTDVETESVLYFIKNRQEEFFMMPDMKQADYLFLEPLWQTDHLSVIKKGIIDIPQIQSCFVIPSHNLKYIDAE